MEPVLIDGEWRAPHTVGDHFSAINPATRSALPEVYPVSDWAEIEESLQAGVEAAAQLRDRGYQAADAIARFLEDFADQIEARTDALVTLAHLETGLPETPRLRSVELPRTTDQLRQAARAARERSWCHATIDTRLNIRSMFAPLGGPVIVFGPNNFPFAFNSAAGGDFAAAIAAGNPVIAKANTGHPGTTRLFAEAALEAIHSSGMPAAMVQLLYRVRPNDGYKLVSHPSIGATAFTGSKEAGMRLKRAADEAGKPIYLEMSSINPIFILPGALDERLESIAAELYASCSLGAGQFCTKPGFVVVPASPAGERFIETVKKQFEENPPGVLLGAGGMRDVAENVSLMQQHGAVLVTGGEEIPGPSYRYANTLLSVSGADFLRHPRPLQTEAFGVVSLIVRAQDEEERLAIAQALEGNLTGSIYSHSEGADDPHYNRLAPILRQKVGRLLNDKMPTGVAVTPAMNHGGPYPATGHPGFTAVGLPAAMLRFAALHCYDNVRHARLPAELQDPNPTGRMWRFIDGEWTQRGV